MSTLNWKKETLPEFGDREIMIGNFRQIQEFDWWFDGKNRRELLLCFSYKNGHAYLIAGKYELHGHLFFKKIRSRLFSRIFTLRPILFFRFPFVTPQQIDSIERQIEMREGTREISCIELLRQVLEDGADIKMNYWNSDMIYLQQFVDSFLRNGFVDKTSNKKIPIETYLTERWSTSALFDHLGRLEKRFYWLGHLGLWTARFVRFFTRPLKAQDKVENALVIQGRQTT